MMPLNANLKVSSRIFINIPVLYSYKLSFLSYLFCLLTTLDMQSLVSQEETGPFSKLMAVGLPE